MANIEKRTIGINFIEEGGAEVRLWAPLAEKVELLLSDESWLPLQKAELGYWETITDRIKQGDLYKFVLDGNDGLPDPASLSQPEGVHGFSQAFDLKEVAWDDDTWNNLPLSDYIIYELHTGTFSSKGDFFGIEEKLDHLIELGVNAIEIMPVAQFPGDRNWGYDGVYPFAVQNSYGGPEGLLHFVNACHQKGLAVILDVVYNHLGPEGNYFNSYGPYFTEKYQTPWGNAINFDDAYCDGVRNYFVENALMWFRDFHIDALRLDAVHAIKDFSPTHILREIKLAIDELMKETGRQHYLVVELDLNDNRFINPLNKQGFGMDAQWIDEFHHALRVTAGQDRTGYYSDFTGIAQLAKSYKDAYVYDGIYSPHRKKKFGVKAEGNPGQQFIVFSQNHDQVGNRMLGERTSSLVSFEMQKLLVGAVLVSPYLPLLFMGEEWSETNPFLYFVSHTDAELVEAVRKGRKAEFAAFHQEGEAPDPVSEETFLQSKLQWDLIEQEPHKTMLNYYKYFIGARKKYPALRTLDRNQVEVEVDQERRVLILQRESEENSIVCLMNFSKQVQEVGVPDHADQLFRLIDSASPDWKGPAAAPEETSGGSKITLQPESIIVYTNTYV